MTLLEFQILEIDCQISRRVEGLTTISLAFTLQSGLAQEAWDGSNLGEEVEYPERVCSSSRPFSGSSILIEVERGRAYA